MRSQKNFLPWLIWTLKGLKIAIVENPELKKQKVRPILQVITVKFFKIRPNFCLKPVNDEDKSCP